MKKLTLSLFALAMTAMTFTSCEDVPAPYDYPGTGGNGGGTELPEGVYLDQNFSTSLGDFQSVGSNPNIAWAIDYSSACITGYKDYNGDGTKSNEAGVTYLVSPEIDLTAATKAHVEMNHAMRYERADINTNNSLLICKDYAGDPTTANWVSIPYSTDGINGTSFDFVDVSANIPDEFIGSKVRLALRHTCSDAQSSTWEVKSLSVKEGEAEISGGGEDTPNPPVEGEYINETFATSFGSFTEKTVKGTPWKIDYSCAKATGYDNSSKTTTPSESYLVSKAIDLSASKGAVVNFEYILRYYTNYGAEKPGVADKVLITDNYTGDVTTTNWTDITGTLTEGSDWNTWYKYSVNIPAKLLGKKAVVIALYYACQDNSATWEVKNFVVKDGEASNEGGNEGGNEEGNEGGGEVSGNTIAVNASDLGFANGTALTTITLSDGTELSFDGGGNTNAPKYYDTGTNIRMYPKNSMKVTSQKNITKINFVVDVYNGTTYNASGDITSQPGTVSISDANVNITDINSKSVTITDTSSTTGAASQIRIKTISITYAD